MFDVVVKDDERGFLFRDGHFVRLLEPGRVRAFDRAAKMSAEVFKVVHAETAAERVAKANLIRRQEETAATRSLLNTSRLMEDNPLLLRLKELEALEKLIEKVGRIDLHTGQGAGGLDALLQNLSSLGDAKSRTMAE
jgi:regulator of protease activity HflC (stomatin/prohibitin superfamily)